MHLAIYDEWTKRKKSDRSAVCVITTSGVPRRRKWHAHLDWRCSTLGQHGEVSFDDQPVLRRLIDNLQYWETSLKEAQILSPGRHILVFAHFQIQQQTKQAFAWSANQGWEFSEHSVHFPTRLMDAYDGLPYA